MGIVVFSLVQYLCNGKSWSSSSSTIGIVFAGNGFASSDD